MQIRSQTVGSSKCMDMYSTYQNGLKILRNPNPQAGGHFYYRTSCLLGIWPLHTEYPSRGFLHGRYLHRLLQKNQPRNFRFRGAFQNFWFSVVVRKPEKDPSGSRASFAAALLTFSYFGTRPPTPLPLPSPSESQVPKFFLGSLLIFFHHLSTTTL